MKETPREASSHFQHYNSPFLSTSENSIHRKTALVILNSPIRQPPSPLFQNLWEISSVRICADGGANRLFDATVSKSSANQAGSLSLEFVPDSIRGDLDSLRPEVRAYYESKGTRVERDPDQDTNDLDKSLQALEGKCGVEIKESLNLTKKERQDLMVCIYGAFGGRFDQEMGCIQALYKWSKVFNNGVFLYDDKTCAFLLTGKQNEIRLPSYGETLTKDNESIGEGPTCGLIPMGGTCDYVRTTGLKWDLDGSTPLEFGGLVSTSNRVMQNVVTIHTSHPLVFTAEVSSGVSSTC